MFSKSSALIIYLTCSVATTWASELCFIEEKPEKYRVVYCKSKLEECCSKGCCPLKNPSELTVLQIGSSGTKLSPVIWFLIVLISLGYLYFCLYFCYRKCKRKTRNNSPITISRISTQPQEMSLMLSFNPNRETLERFNFENNGHLHVPFMPTTPITPPPAYMTLTPPPTYNVAIHFPPIQANKVDEKEQEMTEIKTT